MRPVGRKGFRVPSIWKTTLLILLPALWLTAGCSSEEARSVSSGTGGPREFQAEITFCRKISRKTGRPIGQSDQFVIRHRNYVNALVDFTGVQPGRTHVVHLVWVRPDGRDLFRKYAEVTLEPGQDPAYRTVIRWLDGTDLHDVDTDTLLGVDPAIRLHSRINISQKRDRDPGFYQLRVYLDRRLLVSREFEILPELEPVS